MEQLAGYAEDAEDVEVWPENVQAVELFIRLWSQWRIAGGFGIAYLGIDMTTALLLMDRMRVKKQRQVELFGELQVMEAAAGKVRNSHDDDGD